MSNQIISFTVLISSNFNSWIWISDTNLRGMVMVGLHDQRTLKCCLTRKTFAFIYWNSIHAKGELIRSALGKKLRKGSRPTLIHQHIALVIFIAAAELTENLHLEDCLLLHFLSIVEGKFPSSTLILSEPGFLIHFLSRLQQRRLQFGGTPFVVYRNMEFKLHS